MTILGFFTRLYFLTLYPAAFVYIYALSEITRIRTLGKRSVVRHEAPHAGQKIVLLALYEKGTLRPDVVRMLRTAKAHGCYVLAVNTLRLTDPASVRDVIDCYIERPNFGRDFGSYKTGFQHLFRRGWHKTCPRLLMVNDSVFFTEDRMPAFLSDMLDSEIEVLGSTENFDIDYHLGSFCIAFAGKVVQDKRFMAYWAGYRLTDVRPRVIARGELKLSRVLKRIVSSPDEFHALYGADRYLSLLSQDDDLLEFAVRNSRASTVFAWKRASVKGVVESFRERYLLRRVQIDDDSGIKGADLFDESYLNSFNDVIRYFETVLPEGEAVDRNVLRDVVVADFTESFMSGSQIHQNAAIMLRLGLPIVKLDALYRGICDIHDIRKILDQLPEEEASRLQSQLIARPYGGRYLTGIKRAAFERGLI
jgi:hypothetical protein